MGRFHSHCNVGACRPLHLSVSGFREWVNRSRFGSCTLQSACHLHGRTLSHIRPPLGTSCILQWICHGPSYLHPPTCVYRVCDIFIAYPIWHGVLHIATCVPSAPTVIAAAGYAF